MNNDVIEVQVRAVLPLEGSFAVFLGNETKVFVIYIDESVGTAISMFMRGVSKERPLTHDLVGHLLLAFGARVERVVINNINGSVFHARLIISAENELQTTRKVIELDARPSDSIAMAVQQSAPIFVAKSVWDSVEDVSGTLAQIEKKGLEVQQAAEAAEEEDHDDDDDDDIEDVDEFSDEDINTIAGIEPGKGEDEYDDGFGGDDDDEEGEEWKKADG
ncbi:bifunctional nuclease family protein [Prosthecobacter sp.]|uniref:bifunctional nuclease family protein n=1 Tax=Prosthecobacter sp. TaxID=1965333 RepID=UPI00248974D0|nr:bifunctional nuclease family protein [Prosthecobacter sp.]MDI1314480.1 bifunctional nuclease family protein [Prosthecobacter sp.]